MAQKKETRPRIGNTTQKSVAQMLGKTEAERSEEIRKELEGEVQRLSDDAKQLPRLLDVGAGGTDFSLTPLSQVPKFMHSVSFIFDYLLEPGTEIDPTVVVGLSCALRECAQRVSAQLVRDAGKTLRALVPAE